MKSEKELSSIEKSISKSNAPSKTKPVMEPLFQNTGAKAFVDRPCDPKAKYEEKE
jgi:hypothetical protein